MKIVSQAIKPIIILSAASLVVSFVTCNKGMPEPERTSSKTEYSSVSIVDGAYHVDSNIAMSNGAKEKMLARLEKESLIEKKTVAEIPAFITKFLATISGQNTFDMANPGEEWQEDGWMNGFSKQQKEIVNATSAIARPFPTKMLIYCGVGKSVAMLSYYTGGIRMSQRVIIIKFKGQRVLDLWFDNNSYGCDSGVKSRTKKDGLIKYVKSMKNNNC